MAGKRPRGITKEQARRALYEQVDACPQGQPDTELDVLGCRSSQPRHHLPARHAPTVHGRRRRPRGSQQSLRYM
ncbi:DUF6233 domain-containing protein [Streptomyces durmitorensis]|uniref:DUF6233 domain-containing protein n=1 Tax=Streptomyces durmitorensis TaxID=319947 RepID=A0ABY4PL38_9ACTN|nr:DUF6233 domain-containing protein [Streptomyces durmitorensis]UQT53683.1 DUF6233 domain-containing protein [Streptomyces durmitorensis]